MKPRTILLIATISTLIFTGCQNNDLSAENQSLKQQITELQQKITELEQQIQTSLQNNANEQGTENTTNMETVSSNTLNHSDKITTSVYTTEELSTMVDEFIVSVGSATPDVNNSGNLDQFFSLKREADKIDHALESYENSLEDQYRTGTISRDEYRNLDEEIEQLEELLDSAFDRLEITYGLDD
ncbi:MAG: hypothetical protein IKY94_09050 [Lachnospiraceae bacterium]|nr:hypothetical protein [Lachnospiraceae bacterium]